VLSQLDPAARAEVRAQRPSEVGIAGGTAPGAEGGTERREDDRHEPDGDGGGRDRQLRQELAGVASDQDEEEENAERNGNEDLLPAPLRELGLEVVELLLRVLLGLGHATSI